MGSKHQGKRMRGLILDFMPGRDWTKATDILQSVAGKDASAKVAAGYQLRTLTDEGALERSGHSRWTSYRMTPAGESAARSMPEAGSPPPPEDPIPAAMPAVGASFGGGTFGPTLGVMATPVVAEVVPGKQAEIRQRLQLIQKEAARAGTQVAYSAAGDKAIRLIPELLELLDAVQPRLDDIDKRWTARFEQLLREECERPVSHGRMLRQRVLQAVLSAVANANREEQPAT